MPLKILKAFVGWTSVSVQVSAFVCFLAVLCLSGGPAAQGSDLDTIGATALLQAAPTLNGAGVSIIQAEATLTGGATAADDTFQANPSAVGLPAGIFTYINNSGSIANTFPNSVGSESWHANVVASNVAAVAPGIASIDNYDAGYYFNQVVANGLLPSTVNPSLHNAQIVSQSFVFAATTPADVAWITQSYDSYAARNNVLFVSAAGNSVSPVAAPATAYNGISVNAYSLSPSTSATAAGRSKPDLTAPSSETSYSTPYVTGAAALLLQAAGRNDGGTGTATSASDIRTAKALLLNGADKPAGWSHTATQPLDPVYGAGMVDIYQSWLQLKAGKQTASASTGANSSLQPSGNLLLSSGWDLGSLPNASTTNHYFFTAPGRSGSSDTFTATIDWNVTQWDSSDNAVFNNIDLALYDITKNTSTPVSISDSTVDNIQHLHVTGLVPGDTYDMRIYQASSPVRGATTYGLAYSTSGSGLAVVPEPSSVILLLAGVCGLVAIARRKMAK